MADLLLGIRNAYRGVSSQVLLKYHWGVEHPKTIVTTSIAVAACAAYFFPVTIGSFAFVVFGGKYLIGKVSQRAQTEGRDRTRRESTEIVSTPAWQRREGQSSETDLLVLRIMQLEEQVRQLMGTMIRVQNELSERVGISMQQSIRIQQLENAVELLQRRFGTPVPVRVR